jgi:hypothetical protein
MELSKSPPPQLQIIIIVGNEYFYAKHTNSVALVREWTIPTEQPPLVGEVSANFCG